MPEAWGDLRPWSVHKTFGLRSEWVALYLSRPHDWMENNDLGNRQVESLKNWLYTAGLSDRRGNPTRLCHVFADSSGPPWTGWQLAWVNVTFRFATATWFVQALGTGSWTTRVLVSELARAVSRIALRTAGDAILELVGLLERSPIGYELQQGRVIPTRPRRVVRDGLANPQSVALLYAAQCLFIRESRFELRLEEDLLWPWVVFGCSFEDALPQLVTGGARWLTVDEASMRVDIPLEALSDVALF